jgi:hypothetical protein
MYTCEKYVNGEWKAFAVSEDLVEARDASDEQSKHFLNYLCRVRRDDVLHYVTVLNYDVYNKPQKTYAFSINGFYAKERVLDAFNIITIQ